MRVTGTAGYDTYSRELVITVKCIEEAQAVKRRDEAEIKRVELHLHTNMSALDAVADEADVVKRVRRSSATRPSRSPTTAWCRRSRARSTRPKSAVSRSSTAWKPT